MLVINHGGDRYKLTWFGRGGNVLESISQTDRYAGLRISLDGTRAVLSIATASGNREIWAMDFARGIKTRLWSGDAGMSALWAPGGKRIVNYRPMGSSIFERDASGPGEQETLLESSIRFIPTIFHPMVAICYTNNWRQMEVEACG
jgi:hypothetical protein